MSTKPMQSRSLEPHLQVLSQQSGTKGEALGHMIGRFAPDLIVRPCATVSEERNFIASAVRPGISVAYVNFGQAVHLEGQFPDTQGLVMFDHKTTLAVQEQPRPVEAYDVLFAKPGDAVALTLPRATSVYYVQFTADEEDAAEKTSLNELFEGARSSTASGLAERLGQAMRHHLERLKYAVSAENRDQRIDTMRHELLELVGCYSNGVAPPQIPASLPDPRLLRVSNFIERQRRWEYNPEPLCELAGMSLRNLYYGFERDFGTTPFRFHRNCKLARVRLSLLRDVDQQHPIAWHATNEGFFHLSRFAAQYRNLFGELPSATAQRNQVLLGKIDGTYLCEPIRPIAKCSAEACTLWQCCQAQQALAG